MRVSLAFALACGLVMTLVEPGHAAPIRPDVRKLITQPAPASVQLVPARAGWNGPEIASTRVVNPTLETLTSRSTPNQIRATLLAIAVPDARILALIAFTVLLLRLIRRLWRRQEQPGTESANQSAVPPSEIRPAA